MDYRLEALDSNTFENLANTLCQEVLGIGVIFFASGKDGGRDGVFNGTATKYPDNKNPWKGKFIIQAKHTSSPIASCADKDFEVLVNKEITKLKKLRTEGDVDCYILFTNRKYGGISGEKLRKKIETETGIPFVSIIGKETMNNGFVNQNKAIVKQFGLNKLYIGFDFSDQDIKELIYAFKEQLPKIKGAIINEVDKLKYDFDRIVISEKNRLNKLGDEYFENEILSRSLADFDKLQSFLEDPINEEIKEQYYDIATELSSVITIKRGNFDAFEEIFHFAFQLVADGTTSLKGGKRHVLTLLHYMYFECLIGIK